MKLACVTVNKDIEAFTYCGEAVCADVSAVQISRDLASVMIISAEQVLDDLRNGRLQAPAGAVVRRAPIDIPNIPAPKSHRQARSIGAVVLVAGLLTLGAMFTWPAGNGSATLGESHDLIAASATPAADDTSPLLLRQSSTDAVSQTYAAEFARIDTTNVRCLAEAVYYEARGEPYIGQVAVAQVVMNRARSGKWSRGLCSVISQGVERGEKCQFSYMCRTSRAPPVGAMWDRAQEIAIDAVHGRVWLRELVEATHYHTRAVSPVWRTGLDPLGSFGSHVFYRTPDLGYALSVSRSVGTLPSKQVASPQVPEDVTGSLETSTTKAQAELDFKLPLPSSQTASQAGAGPSVVAAAKPRPLVRQTRTTTVAPATSDPAKSDQGWARDMQNR